VVLPSRIGIPDHFSIFLAIAE